MGLSKLARSLALPSAVVQNTKDRAEPLSFLEYLRATYPAGWAIDPPHIRLIASHLEMVRTGIIDRLMINMPPRHGKTETATVRGAAWMLEDDPSSNVLVTAHNEALARRFSRKAKNIASTRMSIARDSSSTAEWSTLYGGSFVARGVGSPPVGIGFAKIFIDDPIKSREQAESLTYRERAWDWYTDDLLNRLEPGGAIVFTCTRWHEDDVAARALQSEPGRWVVLTLPAICDDDEDLLGRNAGEALWPDRYDVESLERIRDVMVQNEGEYGWLALYQQKPTGKVGAFFEQTSVEMVDLLPEPIVRACRAWDLAATKDGGDYTVGALLGMGRSGRIYVLDVVRKRIGPDERDRVMLNTAYKDGHNVKVFVPTEPGAAGKGEALRVIRLLTGFNVSTGPVNGSKVLRAQGIASQVNAGNVAFLRGDWNRDLLEEMRGFPLGKNDDQIDAIGDALRLVIQKRVLQLL
jgi:predicted phage terminase large subunit-like protein